MTTYGTKGKRRRKLRKKRGISENRTITIVTPTNPLLYVTIRYKYIVLRRLYGIFRISKEAFLG